MIILPCMRITPTTKLVILYSLALSSKDLKAVHKQQLINLHIPLQGAHMEVEEQFYIWVTSSAREQLWGSTASFSSPHLCTAPQRVCIELSLWMVETDTGRLHIIKHIHGNAKKQVIVCWGATLIKNNKPCLCFNFLCSSAEEGGNRSWQLCKHETVFHFPTAKEDFHYLALFWNTEPLP